MQKDLGKRMPHLKVDGGAAANNLLMQLQADYLGRKIYRPHMIETTAAGAAYLAGLGTGFWQSLDEIKAVWSVDLEFQSEISKAFRTQRLTQWHSAIGQAMYHEGLTAKPKKKKATKKKTSKKTKKRITKKKL